MLRAGTTVLFEHKEARHEVKIRPAVILQVIGDRVLLVFGQSKAPKRGQFLQVEPRTHPVDRRADLDNTTFFGSSNVLTVSEDRIIRSIGQLSPKRFMDLDALTVERRLQLAETVRSELHVQRSHLRRRIEAHVRDHHARVDEIADEAKLARARLRALLDEDEFCTRGEQHALAHVLGVTPDALLGPDEALEQ